ncbi:MAG: Dabb family protein [Clostridia bacterium]|nr:Dabb family protein [Clostridia bacterium]
MIKHVVCFKLKDVSAENCKKAAEVLLSMKDNIDYIKEIEVGTDFLHSPRSFDVYLSVVLENEEMLDVYQNDAYHCDVVKAHMHAVAEKSVCIDFNL